MRDVIESALLEGLLSQRLTQIEQSFRDSCALTTRWSRQRARYY